MRTLLIKAVVFVLLNIGLLAVAEALLPEVPTSGVHKRRIIESHLDADTLVVGSSHMLNAVAPELMAGRAVNLANHSQDLYYDCALVRLYAPRMPNLRRVVMEVNSFNWEYSLANGTEEWRRELYYHAFRIRPYEPTWSINYYSRIAAFGYERIISSFMTANPYTPDGWQPGHNRLDPATGKFNADRYALATGHAWQAVNEALVMDLIGFLKTRGVEVVFVRTPAHACHREAIDPQALVRMLEVTNRVASRTGARFLDYFADRRFEDEDFNDGDHLNEQGARKFTKILDADLQAPATDPAGSGP
ncbi:MAG: hypothetical protein NTW19_23130 [Planctomycetota bacterium]|nr:hypothetical protein [Planctomycetota bacterium]